MLNVFTHTDMNCLKHSIHVYILRLHGKLLALRCNICNVD